MNVLDYGEESVSVAFEEVKPEDWAEKVYKPDIQKVVYAYPRTGRPGVDNPDGWDMIPGAVAVLPKPVLFETTMRN